jgi:signal transduction histidine kinase
MPFFISKEKYEKEVSQRTMALCEQIISEMGAEIHDDLIQKLSILRLQLDRIERATDRAHDSMDLILKMQNDFQEVNRTVRTISRKLMTSDTEGGSFQHDIEMLCQNMQHSGMGRIHLTVTGNEIPLLSQDKKYLHRIVQELIHNAFKHSAAWNVWIRINWINNRLLLEVEDDGTSLLTTSGVLEKFKKKNSTLMMRARAIGTTIIYGQGDKGLVARLDYEKV